MHHVRNPPDAPDTTLLCRAARERIAANVRHTRVARGWTQETCAARSGLDRTHVQGIEACRFNPTVDTLAKLANGLDVDLSVLFAPTDPLGPRPSGRPPSTPPDTPPDPDDSEDH